MAATTDQAAFILSIPRRKMIDETQETLRTSAFPSTHVKVLTCVIFLHSIPLNCSLLISDYPLDFLQEKWSKNLYIASICYGRTVC